MSAEFSTSKLQKKAVATAARISILIGTSLFGMARISWGQASESEMKAFPMPPNQGYTLEKAFNFPGDYEYDLSPSSAFPGGGSRPEDYDYIRYTGLSGKRVFVYGAWGTTPVAPPSRNARGEVVDACEHAHASYGVWGKSSIPLPIIKFPRIEFSSWVFLGGGGMSGKRNEAGQCIVSTNNRLKAIDARYSWGQDSLSFDFTNGTLFTELVMAVQANTHGWGSCTVGTGEFKACREPAYFIAFTLP
jgi:hypothetical protein